MKIRILKYFLSLIFILLIFQILNFNQANFLPNENIDFKNHKKQEVYSVLFDQYNAHFVKKVNLTKPLHPKSLYLPIICQKSANIFVTTTLCIHEIPNDIHVSGSVWKYGIWEGHIVEKFLNFLTKDKDTLAIDIGSHIGIFTLFAAKVGRDVLSIEPFFENIIRIHKAAKIEKLTHRITLIANAISNYSNRTKKLTRENDNIGGQSLFIFKNENLFSSKDRKYLVKTITFDDLIDFLPLRSNGRVYQKAVLKIDIEGFEIYAFEKAEIFFDSIDVRAVFMEWGQMPKLINHFQKVDKMVTFFTKRNYVPYKINKPLTQLKIINFFVDFFRPENELPIEYWENWSWDVVWIKK